mmetsp:Transcript_74698/g.161529  ORF Transcript_74698/g.161529 Transcript_74698/m.161529 type:complete len:168 (+) Transcript_74698:953-1456(+)
MANILRAKFGNLIKLNTNNSTQHSDQSEGIHGPEDGQSDPAKKGQDKKRRGKKDKEKELLGTPNMSRSPCRFRRQNSTNQSNDIQKRISSLKESIQLISNVSKQQDVRRSRERDREADCSPKNLAPDNMTHTYNTSSRNNSTGSNLHINTKNSKRTDLKANFIKLGA